MYELDYQPDRLDWNEYFVRYKEDGEIKNFKEFLHFYEPYLDRKVNKFSLLNAMSWKITVRRI